MESGKKLFLFTEGSKAITNASGEIKKSECYIGETIELMYNVASNGDSFFGWISIPADLTGYRRICFDIGSYFRGSDAAFGYDDDYSPSAFGAPSAPEKSIRYTVSGSERKTIKIEIEGRKAGIKDVAAAVLSNKSGSTTRHTAIEIYNVWLE